MIFHWGSTNLGAVAALSVGLGAQSSSPQMNKEQGTHQMQGSMKAEQADAYQNARGLDSLRS